MSTPARRDVYDLFFSALTETWKKLHSMCDGLTTIHEIRKDGLKSVQGDRAAYAAQFIPGLESALAGWVYATRAELQTQNFVMPAACADMATHGPVVAAVNRYNAMAAVTIAELDGIWMWSGLGDVAGAVDGSVDPNWRIDRFARAHDALYEFGYRVYNKYCDEFWVVRDAGAAWAGIV